MRHLFMVLTLVCLANLNSCSDHYYKNMSPVGGVYNEESMSALVNPPEEIPFYLKSMIDYADDKAGKKMVMGRLLAWSTKISVSSGLLELFIEEGAAVYLDERLMVLLRMLISYTVSSPFALDINAQDYQKFNITTEELDGLRGLKEIDDVASLTGKEKSALKYAQALSKTPVVLKQKILNDVRAYFSEKEIVAMAALIAKVNYWARLFEALRVKPAGYTDDPLLHIKEYNTLRP